MARCLGVSETDNPLTRVRFLSRPYSLNSVGNASLHFSLLDMDDAYLVSLTASAAGLVRATDVQLHHVSRVDQGESLSGIPLRTCETSSLTCTCKQVVIW